MSSYQDVSFIIRDMNTQDRGTGCNLDHESFISWRLQPLQPFLLLLVHLVSLCNNARLTSTLECTITLNASFCHDNQGCQNTDPAETSHAFRNRYITIKTEEEIKWKNNEQGFGVFRREKEHLTNTHSQRNSL